MSNLYNMELHETINVEGGGTGIFVTRVPGGWIYESFETEGGNLGGMIFVPFNNEFEDKK